MESMFRSDFNEPMISSKVAMSVEDQRALSQNGNFHEVREWSLSVGVSIEAQVSNLPNNCEFAFGRLHYLKKRFQCDPHLFEKYRDTINGY